MCCITNPTGYRIANICNGFLCFASHASNAPVVICNSITGETQSLPNAPQSLGGGPRRNLFALGFSPSTKEYKLFRLSYSTTMGSTETILDVCTLGDSQGWRQHPNPCPYRPICDGSPPVLVDGKLYVVMYRPNPHIRPDKRPDRLLQIDVASETHCTYGTPEHPKYENPTNDVRVTAFELRGELCLAINTVQCYNPKLQFCVMASKQPAGSRTEDPLHCQWVPRYTFYLNCKLTDDHMNNNGCSDRPRDVWLDDNEMMCYRMGDTLYKYDTRGYSANPNASFVPWNQLKLELPAAGQSLSTQRSWSVCGGYRPTLLSPLTFSPPSEDGDEQFENALLRALRCLKSKQRGRPPSEHSNDLRPAKRIC
jgi:F-box interacting protein